MVLHACHMLLWPAVYSFKCFRGGVKEFRRGDNLTDILQY